MINAGDKNTIFATKNLVSFLLVFAVIALGACTPTQTTISPDIHVELNVCAGVGLTDVIIDINNLYMQQNKNVTMVANFAASGILQKQIEQGAPADIFISAAAKQMDTLQDEGLILESTRRNLLNNKVVLVVPVNSTLVIDDFSGLVDNRIKQIAIGDPEFVPAGSYGKRALDQLNIYDQVKMKLILCSDVRQVLSYVESGNVDAGIVYSTDAAITDKVKIVADAPAEVNNQIVFPVAIVKASRNITAAEDYIYFLTGDEAAAIFEKYGFTVAKK